jgi:2-polyprenyl-3-methyl-5-hydroxy-6-metoxy-1,4-benzoquinol methylase
LTRRDAHTGTYRHTALDRLFAAGALALTRHGPSPALRALAGIRRQARRRAVAVARHRADHLRQKVRAGDAAARDQLARLAQLSLDSMRAEVAAQSRNKGFLYRAVAEFDAVWHDCHDAEYLDDPTLDSEKRLGVITALDWTNELLAIYATFLDAMVPLLRSSGTTRVLDLAAGHGGFALAATRLARARGLDLHFTASDIKQEYLDLGIDAAARAGLPIDFVIQDALDLSNIAPGSFDLVVCTQSLHHFSPGQIALMFESAARVAGRGSVFADVCRSASTAAALAIMGAVRHRSWFFIHDGWVSTRKSFVPDELALLAELAMGDSYAVAATWSSPTHCIVRTQPCEPA